jgi:hypothetical protein
LPELVYFTQKHNTTKSFDLQTAAQLPQPLRDRIVAALKVALPVICEASRKSFGVVNTRESVRKSLEEMKHPSLVR